MNRIQREQWLAGGEVGRGRGAGWSHQAAVVDERRRRSNKSQTAFKIDSSAGFGVWFRFIVRSRFRGSYSVYE